MNIFSNFIPNKIKTFRSKDRPWMNDDTENNVKLRHKLYHRYIRHQRNKVDFLQYLLCFLTVHQKFSFSLFQSNVHKFQYTLFFYKQLGSGLSPKGCLYFQGFWGSKLLNGCLVVWPNNLCLQSKSTFMISDFKISPITRFLWQLSFGVFSVLTAILRLLQRKNSIFL